MDSDQNPSEEARRVGRPPYGLPIRDRRRSAAASDSLGWRRYATPVPPAPRGRRLRPSRFVIVAGLLGSISVGVWSISWHANGSSPRTTVVAMPTPHTEAVVPPPSPISTSSPSNLKPRTSLPSAKPKPRPKVAKKDEKRRRRAAPVVPRPVPPPASSHVERKAPAPRPKRAEERRHVHREPRKVSPYVGWCDELFPPSRPEHRIRNQACRALLG